MTIYTAKDTFEANLVKSKLEEAGVRAFVENETISSVMPNYTGMMGLYLNVRVYIKDKDLALDILDIKKDDKEIKCINCGSENIEFTFGENRFKKYFIIFISAAIGSPMGNMTRDYYCKECGFKSR